MPITLEQVLNFGFTVDDLSEEMQIVAETIGIDGAIKLILSIGGDSIYFPKKESLLRKIRDQTIKKKYDGTNLKELSGRYRLSVRQVRKILFGG